MISAGAGRSVEGDVPPTAHSNSAAHEHSRSHNSLMHCVSRRPANPTENQCLPGDQVLIMPGGVAIHRARSREPALNNRHAARGRPHARCRVARGSQSAAKAPETMLNEEEPKNGTASHSSGNDLATRAVAPRRSRPGPSSAWRRLCTGLITSSRAGRRTSGCPGGTSGFPRDGAPRGSRCQRRARGQTGGRRCTERPTRHHVRRRAGVAGRPDDDHRRNPYRGV